MDKNGNKRFIIKCVSCDLVIAINAKTPEDALQSAKKNPLVEHADSCLERKLKVTGSRNKHYHTHI